VRTIFFTRVRKQHDDSCISGRASQLPLTKEKSMPVVNLPAIKPPAGAERLPDNTLWESRFLIKSQSSSNKYVVAKNKVSGKWACDCPGYKRWRKCKHLVTGFGLSTSQIHGFGSLGTTPERRGVH
jgi:hypothetical protein